MLGVPPAGGGGVGTGAVVGVVPVVEDGVVPVLLPVLDGEPLLSVLPLEVLLLSGLFAGAAAVGVVPPPELLGGGRTVGSVCVCVRPGGGAGLVAGGLEGAVLSGFGAGLTTGFGAGLTGVTGAVAVALAGALLLTATLLVLAAGR